MTCPPWCTSEPHESWHDPCAPVTFVEHSRRYPVGGRLSPGLIVELVQLSEHLNGPNGPGAMADVPIIVFNDRDLDALDAAQARAVARALMDAADLLEARP